MGRKKSRELAMQVLYQIEMTQLDAEQALQFFWENYEHAGEQNEFTARVVKGTIENKNRIDTLISTTAKNWSFNRLTPVDCSILREAVFEILYCPDIPYKVTLNEAIELGKKFGSEKSGSFINGVLDHVLGQNPDLKKLSK
ncbi:MAG: transcription antitermination factor NusB [Pseudomonadota bacterium]